MVGMKKECEDRWPLCCHSRWKHVVVLLASHNVVTRTTHSASFLDAALSLPGGQMYVNLLVSLSDRPRRSLVEIIDTTLY